MHYGEIYRASLADGIGWRVVLFVSGCMHGCKGCHNKRAWDKNYGKQFTEDTLNTIITELNKPEIDGLTISGGDPLMSYNLDEVENICKFVKSIHPEKSIWIYTGFNWENIKHLKLLNYIDVIVDGKFEIENRDVTLPFKGSSNQRIIDVKKSLENDSLIEFKG